MSKKESTFQAQVESERRVGESRDCDNGPSRWSSDASTRCHEDVLINNVI